MNKFALYENSQTFNNKYNNLKQFKLIKTCFVLFSDCLVVKLLAETCCKFASKLFIKILKLPFI